MSTFTLGTIYLNVQYVNYQATYYNFCLLKIICITIYNIQLLTKKSFMLLDSKNTSLHFAKQLSQDFV